MVEDVARFVAPLWADRLDYAALVAVDKEYVAREQRNREALQALVQHKVWRVPVKEGQPLPTASAGLLGCERHLPRRTSPASARTRSVASWPGRAPHNQLPSGQRRCRKA